MWTRDGQSNNGLTASTTHWPEVVEGKGDEANLMEAKVSFYGVGGEEKLSLTVKDHQEPVQGLQRGNI